MKIKYDISKGSLWKVGSAARSNQGGLTKSTMQDIMAGKAVDLDNNLKNSLNLEAVTVQEFIRVSVNMIFGKNEFSNGKTCCNLRL